MRRLMVAVFAALLALGLGLALRPQRLVFPAHTAWHLVPDTEDAYVP